MIHHFDPDDQQLFQDSQSQAIQHQTQQLINQVFNHKYQPIYDPSKTKKRQELYRKAKKQDNKKHRKTPVLYRQYPQDQLTPSFNQFLLRAQQKIDRHYQWIASQKQKQQQKQDQSISPLPLTKTKTPTNKLQPLYQRCIQLQKSKQRILQQKRILKHKKQAQQLDQLSFKPLTNQSRSPRMFQQYLVENQMWKKERDQQLQRKRIESQVIKLNQCTFKPHLVANYGKNIRCIVPGERVEERLLRSLEKSGGSSVEKSKMESRGSKNSMWYVKGSKQKIGQSKWGNSQLIRSIQKGLSRSFQRLEFSTSNMSQFSIQ